MCGIAALLVCPVTPNLPDWPFWGNALGDNSNTDEQSNPEWLLADLLHRLQRRGPDETLKGEITVSDKVRIKTLSTVLSLRGSFETLPSHSEESGPKNGNQAADVSLLFNGEIYGHEADDNALSSGMSDTTYVRRLINSIVTRQARISRSVGNAGSDNDTGTSISVGEREQGDEGEVLLKELDGLRGPWSVVFWSEATNRLYFGKDVLGRRSLLIHVTPQSHVLLTSVTPAYLDNIGQTQHGFAEVPPIGLAYIDLSNPNKPTFGVARRPVHDVAPPRLLNNEMSGRGGNSNAIVAGSSADMYVSFLPARWLRSMRGLEHEPMLPKGQLFENNKDTDHKKGQKDGAFSDIINNGVDDDVDDVVNGFILVLRRAVRRRLVAKFRGEYREQKEKELLHNCRNGKNNGHDFDECIGRSSKKRGKYGLLFSGGIDSMVLARLLDEEMPLDMPLPLINVAFGDDATALSECPDRITAQKGVVELRQLSKSKRAFHLVCIDVNSQQARDTLQNVVRPLVLPCAQPMDATIGTALWMAAQGRGQVRAVDTDKQTRKETESKIQAHGEKASVKEKQPENNDIDMENASDMLLGSVGVLFSGLGADELMAGYKGRHRTVFRTEGCEAVAREMDADISRLWFRNLGRDDRVIADHGREVRHPFLDEHVLDYVTALPLVPYVCNLSLPDGVGDKALLRQAGRRLGLSSETASRAKRAIQFGSRSKQVIERKQKKATNH